MGLGISNIIPLAYSISSNIDNIDSGSAHSILVPISISNDILLGDVTLEITLICDYTDNYSNELTYTKTYERSFGVSLYQSGYPYILSSQIISSPAVIDLDQDGMMDVIFGDYNGMLHVLDEEGNPKPGFPFGHIYPSLTSGKPGNISFVCLGGMAYS